jgi:hypothetical protein
MKIGTFHIADNVCVRRLAAGQAPSGEDGSVRLEWYAPGVDCFADGSTPERWLDLSPSQWASIVSHVSARGETGETYRAALSVHQGARS